MSITPNHKLKYALKTTKIKWIQFYLFWLLNLLPTLPFVTTSLTYASLITSPHFTKLNTKTSLYWKNHFQPLIVKKQINTNQSQTLQSTSQLKLWSWFHNYWLLNQIKINITWPTHHHFKLLFFTITNRSSLPHLVNINKFYIRWKQANTLLLNLFYFDASLLMFSNKLFIEETLIINWQLSFLNYKLFKFSQNLIYFRDNPYGSETRFIFNQLNTSPLDLILITDVKLHKKNMFFLTTLKKYSIGLIPSNYSPWQVSYPIPLLGDSILGQYYFLQSLLSLMFNARQLKFKSLHTSWRTLKYLLN